MSLTSLLIDWRTRLAALAVRRDADPDPAEGWRCWIRIKILRFLIARYADEPTIDVAAALAAPPPDPSEPFCIATPAYHPPRSPHAIASILADLHRLNQPIPPRAWFRWPFSHTPRAPLAF